ncbi:MAG: hypothetical protein ACK5TK_05875 [Betaproteobacteria bacterium]
MPRLLLVDPTPGQTGAVAVPVVAGDLLELPTTPGGKFQVRLDPDKLDALYKSALHGGDLAYRLLERERLLPIDLLQEQSSNSLSKRQNRPPEGLQLLLRLGPVPQRVDGSSGDLLFALVALTAIARQRPYPEFAATGVLDDDGNVLKVEGIQRKLAEAVKELPPGALFFYPEENAGEVVQAMRDLGEGDPSGKDARLKLHAVERLEQAAQALGIPVTDVWPDKRPPYVGLLPFDTTQRAIFFGREAEVEELRVRLLAREQVGQPGVLVVAASGVGKTSLIQAGLLNHLQVNLDRPLDCVFWRLRDAAGRDEAALAASLQDALARVDLFRSLHDAPPCATFVVLLTALDSLRVAGRRLLCVIDPLEELFTLGFSEATIGAVGDLILRLQQRGVWVIGALRKDFVNHYQQQPALTTAFGAEDGVFKLPALRPEAVRQVIEEPAARARLSFATKDGISLADRIRHDVGGATDALPLLQFVLTRLYEKRDKQRRLLTWDAYRESGELEGAIGTAADSVLERLVPAAQDALPRLLRALVRTGRGDAPITARPLDLAHWPEAGPPWELVEALVDNRLLVPDDNGHGGRSVRVPHEALLSQWPRARSVLGSREARKDLLVRDRLAERAEAWNNDGRPPGRLLTAEIDLAEARDLQRSLGDELASESDGTLPAFIKASVAAAAKRRLGKFLLAAVLASAIAVAIWLRSAIEREREVALRSEQQNLAALATHRTNEGDSIAALLIGLYAADLQPTAGADGPIEASVLRALLMNAEMGAFTGNRSQVLSLATSTDGRWLITGSEDGTARLLSLGEPARAPLELAVEGPVRQVFFSADGLRFITVSDDARLLAPAKRSVVQLWNLAGVRIGRVRLEDSENVLAVSPDCKQFLASKGSEPYGIVWNLVDERAKRVQDRKSLRHAMFSPDGRFLASTSTAGKSTVWSIATKDVRRRFDVSHETSHLRAERSVWGEFVAFSPDGRWLASAANDRSLKLCRMDRADGNCGSLHIDDSAFAAEGEALDSVILAFRPDGKQLAAAITSSSTDVSATVVAVWRIDGAGEPRLEVVRRLDGRSKQLLYSHGSDADAYWLVVAGTANDVYLMRSPSGEATRLFVAGPNETLNQLAVAPSGDALFTASSDKAVRMWDLSQDYPRRLTVPHKSHLENAHFSVDGTQLVSPVSKGLELVWSLSDNFAMPGRINKDSSVERMTLGEASLDTDFAPKKLAPSILGCPFDGPLEIPSVDGKPAVTLKSGQLTVHSPNGAVIRGTWADDSVRCAALSRDGRLLATASDDHIVRLWNLEDTARPPILGVGHRGCVFQPIVDGISGRS